MVSASYASDAEVKIDQIKSEKFIVQCGGVAGVYRDGKLVAVEMFVSNATGTDCTNEIGKFRDTIEIMYPKQQGFHWSWKETY